MGRNRKTEKWRIGKFSKNLELILVEKPESLTSNIGDSAATVIVPSKVDNFNIASTITVVDIGLSLALLHFATLFLIIKS